MNKASVPESENKYYKSSDVDTLYSPTMSRRVRDKSRAAVVNYVGDVVRPTYATDLDRYSKVKILEEQFLRDVPYEKDETKIDAVLLHGFRQLKLSKELVTSSTNEHEIQLQLDGATMYMYHNFTKNGVEYMKKYDAHNLYAPQCLIPHRAMPVVLQGWIERHEDGEFRQGRDFDLTYEDFQTNNFFSGNPVTNGSNATCRYRMTVQTVNYRGKPTFGPSRTLIENKNPRAREAAAREMISAMTREAVDWALAQSAKEIQLKAANSGYTDEQLRHIRAMFNNPNFDEEQSEFYEWHADNPMRWGTGLPMFLQLSPQARENQEFRNLNNELGIQFPHTATPTYAAPVTVERNAQWQQGQGRHVVYGFNAKDFIAADSNLFFAEKNGWHAALPTALVSAVPAKEDEHTEDEDGMFEPEPEDDEQDALLAEKQARRAWSDSVARQMAIIGEHHFYNKTKFDKAKKRGKRQEWLAKNKRQPTPTELAEEGVVARTALFPAKFAGRVNYLDPKAVVKTTGRGYVVTTEEAVTTEEPLKKITDRQRADLLLDFVCSYPE